jgi:hypothetical protein
MLDGWHAESAQKQGRPDKTDITDADRSAEAHSRYVWRSDSTRQAVHSHGS